jgi:asparagine synthase (glutamine-hydrolysing)
MIKLRIDAADLAGRWFYHDGSWVSSESRITPFDHASIETFAIELADHRLIVVREHPASRTPRGASLHLAPDADPAKVVAELIAWPLNVNVVLLPKRGDRLEIHTGRLATAPLFLMRAGSRLLGDWDIADLYPHLPFVLDPGRVAFSLCHFGLPYSRSTIFPALMQLTERGVASWCGPAGTLEVRYPQPSLRAMPRLLADGADVTGAFETLLGAAVRGAVNGGLVACELSGGLDSACATIAASRSLGRHRVRSFGLLLPGRQKAFQQARRAELADRAGVYDMPVDAEQLGPFSRNDLAEVDPAIPWGEYYREAFLALGQAIAGAGCDIVVRGIGGDEISELLAGEMADEPSAPVEPASDPFPAYLTDAARRAYAAIEDLDEAPAGFAAHSFYQAAAASAPVYLRRGIWPIYPYGTPEVVDFCRSLPTGWRADRTLQRTLLRQAGLSPEVARPAIPESFLPLRDQMFHGRAAAYVRGIFRKPLLAELGLVDAARLNDAFELAVRDAAAPERAHLLEAATMETVLRTWRRQSIPLGP